MDEEQNPGRWAEQVRGWLRAEYVRPFDAALAWGIPRCRTPEEQRLFPCLLVALSPFNAIIAPRRLSEGEVVSFQVSISRPAESRSERLNWRVLCYETGVEEAVSEEPLILLDLAVVREEPWRAAAQVASHIMEALFQS